MSNFLYFYLFISIFLQMEINGATLLMTVEHTHQDGTVTNKGVRDAVNVWMEHDETTHEQYVCLREMQNWDGKHKGIHVVSFVLFCFFITNQN